MIALNQLSIPYIASTSSDVWGKQLVFEQEKYYHIQAASGKGKSTLINTLYGLQKIYHGQLEINNKNAAQMNDNEWSVLRTNEISIVFQDMKLLDEHTMMENVLMKSSLTTYYPIAKITEFAATLNMQHHLDKKVNVLSYGERQRVAIIRAMMQNFKMILLDEPFSHLDEHNIALASELILKEVKRRNAGLVIADLEGDHRFPYHQKLTL